MFSAGKAGCADEIAGLSSEHGHDKSLEIRPYARLPPGERPVLFYAGDGVSDLSAAKETDLLFAKAGRGESPVDMTYFFFFLAARWTHTDCEADLVTYCENEKVPFTTFNDFTEILATVKEIVAGRLSVKEAATGRK